MLYGKGIQERLNSKQPLLITANVCYMADGWTTAEKVTTISPLYDVVHNDTQYRITILFVGSGYDISLKKVS